MLCACLILNSKDAIADVTTQLALVNMARTAQLDAAATLRKAKISKQSYRLPRAKSKRVTSVQVFDGVATSAAGASLGDELTALGSGGGGGGGAGERRESRQYLAPGANVFPAPEPPARSAIGGGGDVEVLDPTAVDMLVPVGTCTCVHFTSVTVATQQGIETAKLALNEAIGDADDGLVATEAVAVVSRQGLKVVDVRTFEVLADIAIKDITFGGKITEAADLEQLKAECPDSWSRPICVIIHTNPTLQVNTAELLQFGTEEGIARIRDGIKVSKLAYLKELKKQKASIKGKGAKGPFTPTTEPEPDMIPTDLVRAQISRRTLKPIRVLGNGQFGEVCTVLVFDPMFRLGDAIGSYKCWV
jgi:hypothetical protein